MRLSYEMGLVARFVLNQDLSRVVFYILIILMEFILRNTTKVMEERGIEWGSKTHLCLDYADDFSILDENVSIMKEFSEVSWVESVRIGLKISFEKAK